MTLLFQEHNLFAHLTAAQNVGLGLRPDLRLDRAGWARVEAALAAVGLAGLGAAPPGAALRRPAPAGRARARAAARPAAPACSTSPSPRSARRSAPRCSTSSPASAPSRTRRCVLVTHDAEDARRIAEQVVLVDGHRAHPPAPTEALFADPPPELAAYLGVRRR